MSQGIFPGFTHPIVGEIGAELSALKGWRQSWLDTAAEVEAA